jgi:hypothetical protein
MRIRMRLGTRTWGTTATGLAVLAVAVGCASASATGPAPGKAVTARTTAASTGGPHWGTRARSLSLARRLLRTIVLPPGARQLPDKPLPARLRHPASTLSAKTLIDRYRLFTLPVSMARAETFLARHPPRGMTLTATGSSGDHNRVTERMVIDTPVKLPPGISAVELVDGIVRAGHSRALLRTDVQVIWFPRRSAAEHLRASSFRAVRVKAWLYGHKVRTKARTFTSKTVIRRLVRLVDRLPASPGAVPLCPIILATYRVTFEPVPGRAGAVVRAESCSADSIAVGSAPQPALADPGNPGKVGTLAGQLLHLHAPGLTG